ncbi:ER membrane protein complex subunit 1 [Zancudomyces culisetae]|uniref:ER membrane protein complex subunit 1 n=1 Tax=Zancudomyces culisetae TaxID=1213189 RepID=A0A1R1PLK6_ZANCU|nr:ER membrane protein complex subunit 1 [Zancudomyces culisetae]|eukprot:OMH81858.1 ER membrane protein complex subunit 1 [Zancudomyces culisetae]
MRVLDYTLVLLCIAIFGSVIVDAQVYEDQVGKIDWNKQLVGKPKFVLSTSNIPSSESNAQDKPEASAGASVGADGGLIVATEKNVLASLDPESGKLNWRQVFESNDVIKVIKYVGTDVLSISGGSKQDGKQEKTIRMWNSRTGALKWEHTESSGKSRWGADILYSALEKKTQEEKQKSEGDTNKRLIVLLGSSVLRLDVETGEIQWRYESEEHISVVFKRMVQNKDAIFVLGDESVGKTGIRVVELSARNGEKKKSYLAAVGQSLDSEDLAILSGGEGEGRGSKTSSYLVWRPDKNIIWNTHRLGNDKVSHEIYHAKIFQLELMPDMMMTSKIFGIDVDERVSYIGLSYSFGSRHKLVVARLEENVEGMVDFNKVTEIRTSKPLFQRKHITVNSEGQLVSIIPRKDNKVQYKVIEFSEEDTTGQEIKTIKSNSKRGNIEQAVVVSTKGGEAGGKGGASKVLTVTSDGVMCMYEGNHGKEAQQLWCRDEVLTGAVGVAFVNKEIAKSSKLAGFDDHMKNGWITNMFARYKRHLSELTVTNMIQSTFKSEDKAVKFGISKLAVFIAKGGYVGAIDTVGGETVWERQLRLSEVDELDGMESSASSTTQQDWIEPTAIYVTREQTEKKGALVVVVGQVTESSGKKKTVVVTMEGMTGKIVSRLSKKMNYLAKKVLETNIVEPETEQKIIVLVDSKKNTADYWPTISATTAATVEAANDKLVAVVVDGDEPGSTQLVGYKIGGQDDIHTLPKMWTLDLGKSNSQVLHTAGLAADLTVASIGKALANRQVVYKYLNPNVLAVLAGSESENTLTLYVVDKVSGRILHRATHPNADLTRSTGLVLTENWGVYYHYTKDTNNDKVGNWILTTFEMFESDKPDTLHSTTDSFSGYDDFVPFVASQSFILPDQPTALGLTTSHSHITLQDILLSLKNQPLVSIPYMQVDPRRPQSTKASSSSDQPLSQGIPAAVPILSISPKQMISYSVDLKSISHIVSTHTKLESTCLVVAYGDLDVFVTQQRPSGSFDQLGPSFSKSNLVLTTIGLAIACVVVTPLVKRKLLNNNWF